MSGGSGSRYTEKKYWGGDSLTGIKEDPSILSIQTREPVDRGPKGDEELVGFSKWKKV